MLRGLTMPTIHIYQDGKKIESKEFRDQFYIIKNIDNDRLYWETGEEQRLSARGGVIHIWIQNASSCPKISFVRTDWQLIIDGVALERNLYEQIDVSGKTIELRYRNYQFVCSF